MAADHGSRFRTTISAVRNDLNLDLQSSSELEWCNNFLCRSQIRSQIEFPITMVQPALCDSPPAIMSLFCPFLPLARLGQSGERLANQSWRGWTRENKGRGGKKNTRAMGEARPVLPEVPEFWYLYRIFYLVPELYGKYQDFTVPGTIIWCPLSGHTGVAHGSPRDKRRGQSTRVQRRTERLGVVGDRLQWLRYSTEALVRDATEGTKGLLPISPSNGRQRGKKRPRSLTRARKFLWRTVIPCLWQHCESHVLILVWKHVIYLVFVTAAATSVVHHVFSAPRGLALDTAPSSLTADKLCNAEVACCVSVTELQNVKLLPKAPSEVAQWKHTRLAFGFDSRFGHPDFSFPRLDSTVLCTFELQVFVHWLLPHRAVSVTPHLAVWHSLLVPLQICYWLRVVQVVSTKLLSNCRINFSVHVAGMKEWGGNGISPRIPADQRHCPALFQRVKIRGGGEIALEIESGSHRWEVGSLTTTPPRRTTQSKILRRPKWFQTPLLPENSEMGFCIFHRPLIHGQRRVVALMYEYVCALLCRTMPLVYGLFSRGSPVSPASAFRRCSIHNSLHLHRISRPRQWSYKEHACPLSGTRQSSSPHRHDSPYTVFYELVETTHRCSSFVSEYFNFRLVCHIRLKQEDYIAITLTFHRSRASSEHVLQRIHPSAENGMWIPPHRLPTVRYCAGFPGIPGLKELSRMDLERNAMYPCGVSRHPGVERIIPYGPRTERHVPRVSDFFDNRLNIAKHSVCNYHFRDYKYSHVYVKCGVSRYPGVERIIPHGPRTERHVPRVSDFFDNRLNIAKHSVCNYHFRDYKYSHVYVKCGVSRHPGVERIIPHGPRTERHVPRVSDFFDNRLNIAKHSVCNYHFRDYKYSHVYVKCGVSRYPGVERIIPHGPRTERHVPRVSDFFDNRLNIAKHSVCNYHFRDYKYSHGTTASRRITLRPTCLLELCSPINTEEGPRAHLGLGVVMLSLPTPATNVLVPQASSRHLCSEDGRRIEARTPSIAMRTLHHRVTEQTTLNCERSLNCTKRHLNPGIQLTLPVEWLERLPPTKAIWVRRSGGDIHIYTCKNPTWAKPFVGGFSWGYPLSLPHPSFQTPLLNECNSEVNVRTQERVRSLPHPVDLRHHHCHHLHHHLKSSLGQRILIGSCAAVRLSVFGPTRTSSEIFGSAQGVLGSCRLRIDERARRILLGARNERKGEVQLKSLLPGRAAGVVVARSDMGSARSGPPSPTEQCKSVSTRHEPAHALFGQDLPGVWREARLCFAGGRLRGTLRFGTLPRLQDAWWDEIAVHWKRPLNSPQHGDFVFWCCLLDAQWKTRRSEVNIGLEAFSRCAVNMSCRYEGLPSTSPNTEPRPAP
ncbi:hypothetical protein PR048_026180 [Dryococelus australis]|uniref:Uncharacterized protein n=1 Tax=Dryococelus australis TaxID=614101 RepID=A0ABQ9GKN7_9NEOP|nr:hypothetical protein PR048_026180 [Dryococelus australis]